MSQTVQQPLPSGFHAATTATDVIAGIDLTGKVAIVTGGYSGLGVETVRALRSAGAQVIVPTRDRAKAEQNLAGIEGVEIEALDLLDPASITAFAEGFLASGRPLHILVNSAGIMAAPLTRDARGYESHFATNHLGHFQLTALLWPALRRAQGARVVAVASWSHHYSPLVFEDPNYEHRPYERFSAYGQSKTANILFACALDARGQAEGVRTFSLHPGTIIETGLAKHISPEELHQFGVVDEHGKPVVDPSQNLKTVAQGAATSVWCATSPQLAGLGGVYCENVDVAPVDNDDAALQGGSVMQRGVLSYAIDPAAADRLWQLSEELTSTAFPFLVAAGAVAQ